MNFSSKALNDTETKLEEILVDSIATVQNLARDKIEDNLQSSRKEAKYGEERMRSACLKVHLMLHDALCLIRV